MEKFFWLFGIFSLKKGPKFWFFLQLKEHLQTKYEMIEIILGFSESKISIGKDENIFSKIMNYICIKNYSLIGCQQGCQTTKRSTSKMRGIHLAAGAIYFYFRS